MQHRANKDTIKGEILKTLKELTLLDKFLFDEVMDIPEAHEAALRIILGDENLKLLTAAQTEKEVRTAPWLRSIRLDVYSVDENLRIYNTEAQKSRKNDLARRSRFYQSVMDSSLLKPGDESFNLLNDTFTIFSEKENIVIHFTDAVMKILLCYWKMVQPVFSSIPAELTMKRYLKN